MKEKMPQRANKEKGMSEKYKEANSGSIKMRHPDKGAPIVEGKDAYHYDKGYVSDEEYFSPLSKMDSEDYRGNEYMDNQNTAVRRDDSKIKRSKFSKIA